MLRRANETKTVIDLLQSLLGELNPSSLKSHFHLQRPSIPITDSSGAVIRTVTSETPDLLYLLGSLPASDFVQENASLSLRMRRGPPFRGEHAFVWTLTGEKGEIRVTSAESVAIILGLGDVEIQVHDYETDTLEEVRWEWEGWQTELSPPARNVASVYEGVYEDWVGEEGEGKEGGAGKKKKKGYNDWEVALRRHRQIEKAYSDNGF